ncbi:hypothetical protein PVAND_017128 [Polypedilum vanderplanki]|uniref:Uncharacterized protein n=1 Tax=Polypedilum vanderplanki TaxID=319348 RepID=A0A9J6BHC4_POLVA|nr:hypothetical protein PVAND_017128 [Polypedilum vanderplanki]
MSHISEFSEEKIQTIFENFNTDKGIEIEETDDFICIKFETIEVDNNEKSSKVFSTCEEEEELCFQNKSVKRLIKKIVSHEKFFDKITGLFLGDSKGEAVAESSKLGVENFLNGDLEKAQSYFKTAFKNAKPDSEEEKINKELLDVTNLIIDADSDLKERKYNDYVFKMHNAFVVCHNEKMKSTIEKMRKSQVGNFGQKDDEKVEKIEITDFSINFSFRTLKKSKKNEKGNF